MRMKPGNSSLTIEMISAVIAHSQIVVARHRPKQRLPSGYDHADIAVLGLDCRGGWPSRSPPFADVGRVRPSNAACALYVGIGQQTFSNRSALTNVQWSLVRGSS